MTTSNRPENAAPTGMGGATRMYDPSEAAHDRMRRRCMNVAFLVILLATLAQWHWARVHGWDWVNVALLIVAAMPLGLAVKIFELRFKMAATERQAVLRELPKDTEVGFMIYSVVVILVMAMEPFPPAWVLWGIWLYDFVTYYHDRPERIRHLYAVTKTLDEIRDFRAPWAWALPALIWEIVRMIITS